eukprot:1517113-Pyramimonas_sp.AAC.1
MGIGEELPRRDVITLLGTQLRSVNGLTEYTFRNQWLLMYTLRLQKLTAFEQNLWNNMHAPSVGIQRT